MKTGNSTINFFTQMEEWERDHPESTFAKVIEKVDNVIKTGKPFLEVIPDSPFPARSTLTSTWGSAYNLHSLRVPGTHDFA